MHTPQGYSFPKAHLQLVLWEGKIKAFKSHWVTKDHLQLVFCKGKIGSFMSIRKNNMLSLICDTTSSGLDTGMDKWGETIELDITEWLQFRSTASSIAEDTRLYKWRNGDWLIRSGRIDKNFRISCFRVKQIPRIIDDKKKTISIKNADDTITHYSILSRVTHDFTENRGSYWWNVIGTPASIKVGSNTRPTSFCSDVATDLLLQFSLPFESLLTYVSNPLEELRLRIKKGEYTLHNIQFANYMKTKDKKTALRVYGMGYGLITVNKDLARRHIASELGFSFTDYEGQRGYRSGFLLKDKKDEHNLVSLNVYDKAEEGERSGLKAFWTKIDHDIVDNHLRFDITLHKKFFPQLFTAAFGKGRNSSLKPNAANIALAIATIDRGEGFSTWLVRKILIERFGFFSIWAILDEKEDIIDKLEALMSSNSKSKIDYSERFQLWKKSGTMTLKEAIEGAKTKGDKELSRRSSYEMLKKIQDECYLSPYLTAYYISALRSHSKMIGLDTSDYISYYQAVESGADDRVISKLLKNGKSEIQKVIQSEGNAIKVLLKNIKYDNGLHYMYPKNERFQFLLKKAV